MKYNLSDPVGEDTIHHELRYLKSYLSQPAEYWKQGSGDSAIRLDDKKILLFFKTDLGIFIVQLPSHLGPKTREGNVEPITHYVGGEPTQVPSTCFMDEETAFKIMEKFINEQILHEDYEWEDIDDILEGN